MWNSRSEETQTQTQTQAPNQVHGGEPHPSAAQQVQRVVTCDSRFSCHICLEAVAEPVVTQCGHLYCWTCLYRWLEPGMLPREREGLLPEMDIAMLSRSGPIVDETRRCCPVCKAECSVPTLIPVYVRNDNDPFTRIDNDSSTTPRTSKQHAQDDVQQAETVHGATQSFDTHNNASEIGVKRRLRFRSHVQASTNDATSLGITSVHDNRTSTHSNATTDESIPATGAVPPRPPAQSPFRRSTSAIPPQNPQRDVHSIIPPSLIPPSSPHRPSLSHGIALCLWQTLFESDNNPENSSVHSLHHPQQQQQRRAGANRHILPPSTPAEDHATEFLSRIVLILGSFVVVCWLTF